MTDAQKAQLEYPFPVEDIEFRVLRTNKAKTEGYIAAYVDSRAIQRRLDKVVGWENWQNDFEVTQTTISKSTTGQNSTAPNKISNEPTFVCKLSIYSEEKGEWLTKSNGAGTTDIEPIKGGLSSAFKRAASMWGIGRYLYDMKDIKCPVDQGKYIPDNEKYMLEQKYIKFIDKLLAEKNESGKPPSKETEKEEGTKAAANEAPPKTQGGNEIPEGRFSGKQSPKNKAYWVSEVKYSPEKDFTLVVLDTPFGEKVKGFIKGQSELKNGDAINNPVIESRKGGNSSSYNLITGYEKAA